MKLSKRDWFIIRIIDVVMDYMPSWTRCLLELNHMSMLGLDTLLELDIRHRMSNPSISRILSDICINPYRFFKLVNLSKRFLLSGVG